MFGSHKMASSLGAIGIAAILGHVVLGRSVVPPPVALVGAALVAISASYLAVVRRGLDRARR